MQADSTPPTQASQEAPEATTVKPTSRVSRWFNRVSILVILVVIPLLYYFGYISVVWLNRIGIILNFCAGFMLAPELIGAKRLQRMELLMENVMFSIIAVANKYKDIIERPFPGWKKFETRWSQLVIYPILLVVSSWFVYMGEYYLVPAVFLVAAFIGAIVVRSLVDYKMKQFLKNKAEINMIYWGGERFRWGPKKLYIDLENHETYAGLDKMPGLVDYFVILLKYMPINVLYIVLFLPLSKLIIILLLSIRKTFEATVRKLLGEDRLKSIFIWWGIIFFIVGNALQFIASF
jgi:hypothetical protein